MDIVLSIKKHFAIKKLTKWSKLSDIPSIRRIKDVDNGKSRVYTSEFEKWLDNVYIRRYFDANRVCVDVYWHIKPTKHTPHIYSIHYRRDWNSVAHTIDRVEKHELPRELYEAFKQIK